MSGLVRKAMLAAALSLLAIQTVSAQTADNLIADPNFDIEAASGSPTLVDRSYPPPGSFANLPTAAADWFVSALVLAPYRVETELVPSDLVAGGRMLHVRANSVALMQVVAGLTSQPTMPHAISFCVWIKVVHGGAAAVAISGAVGGAAPTGAWQQLLVNVPNATSSFPGVNLLPFASFDNSTPRLGEVEFYLQAATLSLHPLTTCPQRTLDSLATGSQRLSLPPQYPVIEHPQWTVPAPLVDAPYGQGTITPAYVPGPNTPPPPPSNAPVLAAPSNTPGGKK